MNEQAWKEQAALEPCPFCGEAEKLSVKYYVAIDPNGFDAFYVRCDKCFARGPNVGVNDYDREPFKNEAAALWNNRHLVQQAIAAERGEPVAVPHVVYDMKMPPYHYQKPYTGSGGSISVPSAPPTEAQIRAEAYERCAKVAEGYVGSTPPRYESGIERRATTSQQADNCLNAIKVRAATIAAAIRSLKEADNGAEGT